MCSYNYSANAYVYEWARAAYGTKQFVMSETGYPTFQLATNEEVQAAYFLRLILEGFLYLVFSSNICVLLHNRYNHKLVCLYEIWDSGPDPNDIQQHYGIVRYNLTVKPAYL